MMGYYGRRSLKVTKAQLEERRLGASHPVMEKKISKTDLALTEYLSNGKCYSKHKFCVKNVGSNLKFVIYYLRALLQVSNHL